MYIRYVIFLVDAVFSANIDILLGLCILKQVKLKKIKDTYLIIAGRAFGLNISSQLVWYYNSMSIIYIKSQVQFSGFFFSRNAIDTQ